VADEGPVSAVGLVEGLDNGAVAPTDRVDGVDVGSVPQGQRNLTKPTIIVIGRAVDTFEAAARLSRVHRNPEAERPIIVCCSIISGSTHQHAAQCLI